MTADQDRAAVRQLLGREPQGDFDVVARDGDGRPVVIRNAPWLADGTPMPTRYWLVGGREVREVSRLESTGGVRQAEAEIDAEAIADAHRRYAAERDAAAVGRSGPSPSGGVGGTRQGVKCLHAHYAWHLAGGDDPVGRWVAARLGRGDAVLDVTIAPECTSLRLDGVSHDLPVGPVTLLRGDLRDPDPPAPAQLTNALGTVADHLDDVIRDRPAVLDARPVHVAGDEPWHLVVVERGAPIAPDRAELERSDAEDLFRLLATETRGQRLTNPGLDPARVDTVLGTCCVIVAIMRRLELDRVLVTAGAEG